MAYGVRNIDPLDLKPSTGVGVALPFSQASVFRTVYTTQEQTRYNLINYILTNPGERIFEPEFGLGLRKKLFEHMVDEVESDIIGTIQAGIESYFPKIQVQNIEITRLPENNSITVYMSYKIVNTNQEDEILINIENG